MRLGGFPCRLVPNTLTFAAYEHSDIRERHRHRYEFNNEYLDALTSKGLIISGTSPDGRSWKSLNCKVIPGLWAHNFILNFSQGYVLPIRFLRHLLAPHFKENSAHN